MVTLMGVHTFGGARPLDSGYAGMWTQSKGQFNSEYLQQLVQVLPVICNGPGDCILISEAGDNRSDIAGSQVCIEGQVGRCEGWEQKKIVQSGKFQWRNACRPDGTGCTHLMLNIDIGLYRDLHTHICSLEDEQAGVVGTLDRPCKEGMIKDYPELSDCDKATSRVLATCFNTHTQTSGFVEQAGNDLEGWIAKFGPLFDTLLTFGQDPNDLTELVPPITCVNDVSWTFTKQNGTPGHCNWVYSQPVLENACEMLGNDDRLASEACPIACHTCSIN
jgi:hypothetical protein